MPPIVAKKRRVRSVRSKHNRDCKHIRNHTPIVFLFLLLFTVSCLTFNYISILDDSATSPQAPHFALDTLALTTEVSTVSTATATAVTTETPTSVASTATSAVLLPAKTSTQTPSTSVVLHVTKTRTESSGTSPVLPAAEASRNTPAASASIPKVPTILASTQTPAAPAVILATNTSKQTLATSTLSVLSSESPKTNPSKISVLMQETAVEFADTDTRATATVIPAAGKSAQTLATPSDAQELVSQKHVAIGAPAQERARKNTLRQGQMVKHSQKQITQVTQYQPPKTKTALLPATPVSTHLRNPSFTTTPDVSSVKVTVVTTQIKPVQKQIKPVNVKSVFSVAEFAPKMQIQSSSDKHLRAKFMAAPNAATAKVAVVTLHRWKGEEWIPCTFGNSKKKYCENHGYVLLDESNYPKEHELPLKIWMQEPNKIGRFGKLQYLEMILRAQLPCEWLLWVDGDTIFTNLSYTVENRLVDVKNLLRAETKNPIFVLTKAGSGKYINNGVWLIRNSLEAHQVILKIFNEKNEGEHGWADQLSLVNFMTNNPEFVRDKMLVLPKEKQHHWQVYSSDAPRDLSRLSNSPAPVPWILHLPGMTMESRKIYLKKHGLYCNDKDINELKTVDLKPTQIKLAQIKSVQIEPARIKPAHIEPAKVKPAHKRTEPVKRKPVLSVTPSAPATPQVPLNADKLLRERFMAAPNARTTKVAVVTLHMWKNAPKWIDCSFAKSKQEYCAQHGYALLDESYFRASLDTALALKPWMLPPSKTPRYRKLQYLELILRARLPFEWLLWVDGDTVFTNPSYTLENRLSNVKSKLGGANAKDPVFVLTRDQNGINNGVWLIRNSLEAHKAIIDIFNQKNDVKRYWADQLSLINFMKSNPQFVKDNMLVLPKEQQPHWQAYDRHPMRPLPWILHLAGHGMDRRKKILKARGFLCGDVTIPN